MKFKQRLAFFMGGFSIGVFFLLFFLNGKRTSCAYFPNERVLRDFSKKQIRLAPDLRAQLVAGTLDTTSIQKILKYGDVDFSASDTDATPCKLYLVEGQQELENTSLWVENCSEYVTVKEIRKN